MSETREWLERRLAGEQQTLALPLRALLRKEPVTCGESMPVREVAALMRARGVGSVVVLDAESRPAGIFTSTDLVAVAADRSEERPVAEAMSRDLVWLPAYAMAYEAALAMVSRGIRHVLVTQGGKLTGVVSERDLFSLQRLGLGEITTEIRLAGTVELLAGLAGEIRKLARMLVAQGVAPEPLTHFVSVLNDRLAQRVVELERKNHRWESISWCWLAFGSEGRLEQTFSTDQDNGLIFLAHDGTRPDAVRAQMLPFARAVNDALHACGFPLCKGNIMASNPRLCLSLGEWQERIRGWIENPEPKALLDAAICFDFRALQGDVTLTRTLRDWVHPIARAHPAFLRLMAENALQSRPPLGRIRDFATEDAPNHPHSINLKANGTRPFVDAARIYALAHGLNATATGERLRSARAAMRMGEAESEALVQAFFVIQGLRLRRQAALQPGEEEANRIDPSALNPLERRILKGAFLEARNLQTRLALDYQV